MKTDLVKCVVATLIYFTVVSGLPAYKYRSNIKAPPPELPPGETMDKFAKTCEYCGDVFGFEYTYKCLYDPTFKTYKDCMVGLSR